MAGKMAMVIPVADGWNEVVKYDVYHERMEVGYKKFVGEYEFGTLASATIPNTNSYCPELLGQYDSEAEAIASIEGETSRSWKNAVSLALSSLQKNVG